MLSPVKCLPSFFQYIVVSYVTVWILFLAGVCHLMNLFIYFILMTELSYTVNNFIFTNTICSSKWNRERCNTKMSVFWDMQSCWSRPTFQVHSAFETLVHFNKTTQYSFVITHLFSQWNSCTGVFKSTKTTSEQRILHRCTNYTKTRNRNV
jgi:hypothetical protein